jgi:hypothetical protein
MAFVISLGIAVAALVVWFLLISKQGVARGWMLLPLSTIGVTLYTWGAHFDWSLSAGRHGSVMLSGLTSGVKWLVVAVYVLGLLNLVFLAVCALGARPQFPSVRPNGPAFVPVQIPAGSGIGTVRPAYAGPPQPGESYYIPAPSRQSRGRPSGWYAADGAPEIERFWDGRTWTAERPRVGDGKAAEPVGIESPVSAQGPRWA